jgi:hypothetical protein
LLSVAQGNAKANPAGNFVQLERTWGIRARRAAPHKVLRALLASLP